MATFETWIQRGVITAIVFLPASFSLGLLVADGSVYVPPSSLRFSVLIALSSISLFITIVLGIRRATGRSKLEWFLVFAFLPTALLLSIFALQCTERSLAALLSISGAAGKEVITVISSKDSSGRGCKVRNEFQVGQQNTEGYWCTSNPIATGSYNVDTLFGSFGTLIMNPPGVGQ